MRFTHSAAAAIFLLLAPRHAIGQQTFGGQWQLTLDGPMGTALINLTLKLDGDAVTGDLASQMGSASITGTIAEGMLSATAPGGLIGSGLQIAFTGKLQNDEFVGTMTVGDFGEYPFIGKRPKKADTAPPARAPGRAAPPKGR